ncbi:hypothetical protein SPFM15_00058 [Salmonella phage SPFM15]|nr:hypothetical protein SPFM5_00053 [Salmonella phage SPFM5]VFR13682.1 hypothetical protein SPFM15_00058 [Salmonella phage SPFM15]
MFKDQEVKGGKRCLTAMELYKVIDEKWDWNEILDNTVLAYMQNNYHRLEMKYHLSPAIRDMCDSNPRLRRALEITAARSGANYTLDLLPGTSFMRTTYHLSLWHYLSDTLKDEWGYKKGGHTGVKFKMVFSQEMGLLKAMNASVNDLKEIVFTQYRADQTYNAKTGVNEEKYPTARSQLSFLTNSLLVATKSGELKQNGKLLDDAGDDLKFAGIPRRQLADDAGKAMAAGGRGGPKAMMSRWPSAFARGGFYMGFVAEVGDSEQNILNAHDALQKSNSIDSLSEWHTSSLEEKHAKSTPFPDPIRRSAKKILDPWLYYIRDEVEKRFKEYMAGKAREEGRYNMVGSDIMAGEEYYSAAAKANGLEVSPTGGVLDLIHSKYDTEVTAALSRLETGYISSTLLDFCIFMILQRYNAAWGYLNGGFAHIMGFAGRGNTFKVYTIMDHALGNYERGEDGLYR